MVKVKVKKVGMTREAVALEVLRSVMMQLTVSAKESLASVMGDVMKAELEP